MHACSNEQEANSRDVVIGVRAASQGRALSKCGGWSRPGEGSSERVRVDSSPWRGRRQLVSLGVRRRGRRRDSGDGVHKASSVQLCWNMGSGSQLDEAGGPSRSYVYEFFWPGNVIDRSVAVSGWGRPISARRPRPQPPNYRFKLRRGCRGSLALCLFLGGDALAVRRTATMM